MPVIEVFRARNTKPRDRAHARRLRAGCLLLAITVATLTACGNGSSDNAGSIVRTTTNVAGADVVGLERDTAKACPLPSEPDQATGTHAVTTPSGVVQVPADPKRIVVLDTAALDAVCALGLWQRVQGATASPQTAEPANPGSQPSPAVPGSAPEPSYLGYGLQILPDVGAVGSPDVAKISARQPDLILGTVGDGSADALRGVAPTVLIGKDSSWQASFSAFAAALGRSGAGAKAVADYHAEAQAAGAAVAAKLSQLSVLRFDAADTQVQGDNSFAGAVLADADVQRPTAQRGPSFTVSGVSTADDRHKVEGDAIFVMFDGSDGLSHGKKVMGGDDWKKLGAVSDNRTFVVDNTVWHGSGITAARAILEDLRTNLNGYVGG
ncbi:ABC transporter substrate-binding protein [Nocardia sp. NEAU-G5]|uniref:ABC transporter substrate-binding protein n=1 Tax=Nocardia albiluteola TaxID=2842303 RepID=A0ABS6B9S9_9NOCA|nr:ABC transporter substrate-binding protein [Nocardia albiluteola]MBU3066496.1 ABC transporter substrate-binding protein [Nocardia albiluteola]